MTKEEKERLKVKNIYQQLQNELKEDYGLSPIESKALIKRIIMFENEITSDIRKNNQILKQVVALGEPAGKRIRDCKLVTVRLSMSLFGEEELQAKKGLKYLRKLKVHQLCWEAYEQGGLLSYEDISSVLGISTSTIKRIVKEYREKDIVVPSRGQIEDIGPGITHKEKILELLIKGYSYSEVMLQTAHTEASIENYEKKFVRVSYFYRENKSVLTIKAMTGYSESLIKKYIELYENYKEKYSKSLEEILERFYRYMDYDEKKII